MGKQGKIILMVGISGSGKSTVANSLWEKDPKNTVVVSRDKMREMLFSYSEGNVNTYYERKDIRGRENQVTTNLDEFILNNVNRGMTVLVDNTHLKRSYLDAYMKFRVPVTLVIVNTTLEVALDRDSNRVRTVGSEVIKKQFNQFKTLAKDLRLGAPDNKEYVIEYSTNSLPNPAYDPNKDECVIFDIDGTIAQMVDRMPYDWNRVKEDIVKDRVVDYLRAMADEYPIVICTGRDGVCEDLSKEWLYENKIPFDAFFIRKEKDQRPDFVVKEEMWKEIEKTYNIHSMVDDRAQVVNHARSLGYTVLQVAHHTF